MEGFRIFSLCDVENEHHQNSRSTDARSQNAAHLADICEMIASSNQEVKAHEEGREHQDAEGCHGGSGVE